MAWALRLAAKNPATWILGLSTAVLFVVMPSDRETAASMLEEACNTARSFALYAGAVYCGVHWGVLGDARLELSAHLAGTGFKRQRLYHFCALVIVVAAAPAALTIGCMVRWALFTDPADDLVGAMHSSVTSAQTVVYLALSTIAVIALTTFACAGRPSTTSVPCAVLVPALHTVIYFGVDVPGARLLLDLWPTTAAGVVARGGGNGAGIVDGVLATLALTGAVGLAALRLSSHPSFGVDTPHLAGDGELRDRVSDASRQPMRPSATRRRIVVATLVVAALGVSPVVLIHAPEPLRISTWIQRESDTDPVTAARDFVQAAQQGDLSQLEKLTGTSSPADVARQLPAPILRGSLDGTFSLRSSARIDQATVEANYSGDAVYVVLKRSDGRWMVSSVKIP